LEINQGLFVVLDLHLTVPYSTLGRSTKAEVFVMLDSCSWRPSHRPWYFF